MIQYTIDFSKAAGKSIQKYKKSNPVVFKKICSLLEEMAFSPYTGTGHPEPLKNGGGTTYSRRITAHHRIIYDVYDDIVMVLVLSVEGHYDDK